MSDLTFFWSKAASVFNIHVRKCAMDVGAYFLACLSGAKDPDHWDFRLFRQLIRADIIAKLRVISGRRCLIEVDAILSPVKKLAQNITNVLDHKLNSPVEP